MAIKDTLKFYCCTLQGLLRLKLIIGLILGLLIMLAAILTLINPLALLNPFNYLRQVWNAVFGFLILAAQPGWQKIPICNKILGRFVARFGSALSVYGVGRLGSSLSILDFVRPTPEINGNPTKLKAG